MTDTSSRRLRFDPNVDTPEFLAAVGLIAFVAGVFMLVERGLRFPVGLWCVAAGPASIAAGLAMAWRNADDVPAPTAEAKRRPRPLSEVVAFDSAEQGQFVIQVGGRVLPNDDTDEMEIHDA